MPTELLTVREVAERLKLNPQTVRRWIRAGLLPASRVGRRQWRVRIEDVESRQGDRLPELTDSQRAAIRRIWELGEEFSKSGVRVDVVELVRESRRELEERGAPRDH
ncbi:MAG: helix-turn-helix domain-containing protein [Armatimonadota bacterium]